MGGSQLSIVAKRRMQNEQKQIEENPPAEWKIIGKRQKEWDIEIKTDINTPYHSVPFKVTVQFPDNYPQEKPNIKLQNYSRFYHPNISNKNGRICQNSKLNLNNPNITVRERIDAFINLLEIPNPSNPLNMEAAKQCSHDYNQYYKKALYIYRGIIK